MVLQSSVKLFLDINWYDGWAHESYRRPAGSHYVSPMGACGPQVCEHASQPYGFFLTVLLIFKCNPLTVTFADDM